MDDCRAFEETIDRVAAGEADAAERRRLAAHLERCADCAELFDLLDGLAAAPAEAEPSTAELETLHRRVLEGLTPRRTRGAGGGSGWRLAWAAALAAAAFAGGWLAGGRRETPPAEGALAANDGGELATLAHQIRTAAARHDRFRDVEDSPYVYSDVRVERLAGDRVRLSFDVARHLDLELDRRDPLLADVLVQAVTGPSPVGARIAAIDLAGGVRDRRVEQALVVALRHDDNLGVRFRALEGLAPAAADPDVEAALLEVLAEDPDVSMRLAAIDSLTRAGVAPGRLERALGAPGAAPAGSAVRARAARYLAAADLQPRGDER